MSSTRRAFGLPFIAAEAEKERTAWGEYKKKVLVERPEEKGRITLIAALAVERVSWPKSSPRKELQHNNPEREKSVTMTSKTSLTGEWKCCVLEKIRDQISRGSDLRGEKGTEARGGGS